MGDEKQKKAIYDRVKEDAKYKSILAAVEDVQGTLAHASHIHTHDGTHRVVVFSHFES